MTETKRTRRPCTFVFRDHRIKIVTKKDGKLVATHKTWFPSIEHARQFMSIRLIPALKNQSMLSPHYWTRTPAGKRSDRVACYQNRVLFPVV